MASAEISVVTPAVADVWSLCQYEIQRKPATASKADHHRQDLVARQVGGGVADQPDERERPNAAERVLAAGRLALLAFEPHEKRQEQHQDDLDRVGRQRLLDAAHDGASLPPLRRDVTGLPGIRYD